MTKRVLDVGNCAADHAAIRRLIESHFDAQVIRTHGPDDALVELRTGAFDLVLVNRKLDRDGSDGLDIIRRIKRDAALANTPCMLISNYPESQAQAAREGAEAGFGKAELDRPETADQLRRFLG